MSTLSKKICWLGDIGQSSPFGSFVEGQFRDDYLSIVGVKISSKIIELPDLKQPNKLRLQLVIWYLEGDRKFKAIARSYLQGASGAVIIANDTRPESLERLVASIELFSSVNPNAAIVMALNQSDSIDEENPLKMLQFAQFSAPERVFTAERTSANPIAYVDEILQKLAYKIIEAV